MPTPFDTEAKQIIRSQWSKPLLKFLHDTLNAKLIYLGLPSKDPLDIYEWIDYLEEVYAFQCREYDLPSEENQSREVVLELEKKLRDLEKENQLSYSMVYDGYIEEVVLRGFDNNPQPIVFEQDNTVTVYNLDFCNKITFPITYEQDGQTKTAYKFEVIKELLRYQKQVKELPKKFLFFLTVRATFKGNHLKDIVKNSFEKYYKKVSILSKKESEARLVKAYIFKILSGAFHYNNFKAEFLPVIRYQGGGNSKPELLHFTILGTQSGSTSGGIIPIQNPDTFLKKKFITPEENKFILQNNEKIDETNSTLESLTCFKRSKTVKKIWKTI